MDTVEITGQVWCGILQTPRIDGKYNWELSAAHAQLEWCISAINGNEIIV